MEAEKENILEAVGTKKTTAMDEETLKMLNGGVLPASSRNGDNSSGHQKDTLQQRFARFRKERQRERKLAKFVAQPRMNADKQSGLERSKEFRDGLRAKFVSTAKKYLGVPYAASYHPTPDCEHYNAPLYLDCCGLVRRSLQDLAEDFGFKIGRWNQNYQFDTLNHETNPPLSFEQLRPGDLVFVEGRYFNERAKRQKYDLVHVEIFLGASEGPGLENSTIGARHQRGVCCVHPSYKYTSKSYEILKYHFRSIEPWLRSELQPAHPEDWKSCDKDIAGGTFNVVDAAGKRSIFDDEASEDEEEAGDLNTDTELEAGQTKSKSVSKGYSSNDGRPIFYVEKGNGWKLVSAAMEKFGWARLPFEYGFRTSFDLKWVQLRSQIDYVAHKEGQLVNHIPNNTVLTSKLGLLETLREYFPEEQFPPKWFPESFRLDLPSDGLRLLARHDDLLAKKQKKEWETNGKVDDIIWILKPSSANCGRGIILVSDAAELRKLCFPDAAPPAPPTSLPNEPEAKDRVGTEANVGTTTNLAELAGQYQLGAELPDEQHCSNGKSKSGPRMPTLTAGIAQRYLARPLLLQGRKFDIRMYILIARASKGQMLAYVHHGYARLSLEKYSLDSLDNHFVHLTNASIQKKHTEYAAKHEDSLWSCERLEALLIEEGRCDPGWATRRDGGLQMATKRIALDCIVAARDKLQRKDGYFDLLGMDLLVDEQLGCHLLEINTNPALHLDNDILGNLLPGVVEGALGLVLGAHGKDLGQGDSDTITSTSRGGCGGYQLILDEDRHYQWSEADEPTVTGI